MSVAKEPWDFEKFVTLYDEIADAHPGSWYFDRKGHSTSEILRGTYEDLPCTTLREFATTHFEYEQHSS